MLRQRHAVTRNSLDWHWRHPWAITNSYLWMLPGVIASLLLESLKNWYCCMLMNTMMWSPSLPGFFSNSYFCARCLKPYNNEGQHACENNPDHCSSCLQTGCQNFTEARCRNQPPATLCRSCKRMFYGDVCFKNHLTKSYKGKTTDSKNISVLQWTPQMS